MNYRHAYHAGNFADVMKHIVLSLVLEHLKLKPKAFCVVDTHAGSGSYRLDGPEAIRTGEWRDGIGRLVAPVPVPIPGELKPLLEPYLQAVQQANPDANLTVYPGSPRLALSLLREQDRLVANELHPVDAEALRLEIGRDRRARLLSIDGWQALKANLPPKERRGVVLIDPPFEVPGEFERLLDAIDQGRRRFATGIYLLWFPIKSRRTVAGFEADLARSGAERLLWAELVVDAGRMDEHLAGSGLVVLNPPFRLEDQLRSLLPFLAEALATNGAQGQWAVRQPGILS